MFGKGQSSKFPRGGLHAPHRRSTSLKNVILGIMGILVLYFVFSKYTSILRSMAEVSENNKETLNGPVVPITEKHTVSFQVLPGKKYVWLDVEINGESVGRIYSELHFDIVPKTAENFRALVTGEKETPEKKLSYKGSVCHRILKNFIVQCGDFETGKGYGGQSIYGKKFADEKPGLQLKHDKRYILQMANAGPDTNGSQFCFMLSAAPHLNGKHVVFGRVVQGFEVVDKMEAAGVISDYQTLQYKVVLVGGGEYIAP